AYEAADCGLLSADLAAGIRRVKGVKKLGMRLGNWLTAEQVHALWQAPDSHRLKGKRDRALLSLLLACGLRRHEAVALTLDHLQQREEHWAIVDLVGKGGHVRTVPVPDWVKTELDDWLAAAAIDRGRLFRRRSATDLCSALPRIGNSSPTLLFYDGWRVPTNARGNVLEFLGRRTRAVIAGKVRTSDLLLAGLSARLGSCGWPSSARGISISLDAFERRCESALPSAKC
ncbi:MAG: tyrosine-type recombinase/integrase, partial [Candidatus Acidiferrales bacterium]